MVGDLRERFRLACSRKDVAGACMIASQVDEELGQTSQSAVYAGLQRLRTEMFEAMPQLVIERWRQNRTCSQ